MCVYMEAEIIAQMIGPQKVSLRDLIEIFTSPLNGVEVRKRKPRKDVVH